MEDGKLLFKAKTRVDENENIALKSQHPLRWKLGLVLKSKSKLIIIGATKSIEDARTLSEHLSNLGIEIDSIYA